MEVEANEPFSGKSPNDDDESYVLLAWPTDKIHGWQCRAHKSVVWVAEEASSLVPLQYQSSNVGHHQARIEGAGTVDVANLTLGIYEKNSQSVLQWSGGIVGVLFFVNGLPVRIQDGLQCLTRLRCDEMPLRCICVRVGQAGVSCHALLRVMNRIKAHADQAKVFCDRWIFRTLAMKLHHDARCHRAGIGRSAARVDETDHGNLPVRELPKSDGLT